MRKNWLKGFLLLCFLFSQLLGAQENPLQTIDLSQSINIDKQSQFSFFHWRDGNLPQSQEDAEIWLNSLIPSHQTRASGKQFVAAVRLHNTSDIDEWFIYPSHSISETIKLLHFSNAGKDTSTFGFLHQNPLNFHYGDSVTIEPGDTSLLILVFENTYKYPAMQLRMMPAAEAATKFNIENLLIMLSLGMCLALCLYQLYLFSRTGDKAYLFFTLTVSSLALGWSNLFGVWQIFGLTPLPEILMPMFLLGATFCVFFAKHFLHPFEISTSAQNALNITPWVFITVLPITVFAPGIGTLISFLSTGISSLVMLYASIDATRRGFKPARYLSVAMLIILFPFISGLVVMLDITENIHSNRHFLMLFCTTLGSLIMSFALADKQRLITSEKQNLATDLEQKVYMRTEALAEANVALEHLISELQEASSAKSHFLANMSHEIRTPLTSIIGYADSILMGDIGGKEQSRVMRIISDSGNHLLHIINDILDISKIEADKLEFELLPTSPFDVIGQVESMMSQRARDKGLEFNLEFDYPFPSEIITDPTRFRQILFNLINNAIKFTEIGSVDIKLTYADESIKVVVRDTGIGMDLEKTQTLFNPFEQGESSTTRKFGGTGLGLSISKRLANGLGGDISVDSTLGAGSVFEVTIAAQLTENCKMVQSAAEVWQVASEQPRHVDLAPDFSGAKVLLVDDHPNNRELISILLKRMNIEVDEAEDGEQALTKVFSKEYDLVLMDIQMPTMSGDEATERIRQYGYQLPIIALTANNMKHEIELYMQKGFTNHLAKPIVREAFIATLANYLKSSGSNDSLFDNEEMYPLVAAYYTDLKKDVVVFQQLWEEQTLDKLIELAHRIKGAAGSFGFAGLGEKFAAVEESLKKQELEPLPGLVDDVITFGKMCTDLPGIDIPRGVTNYDVSADSFLPALSQFVSNVKNELEQLNELLDKGDASIGILLLNRMLNQATKLAWENMVKILQELDKQLKINANDNSVAKQLVVQAREQADDIANRLSHS
ncbi:MAG: response regulator [Alteromonadaceae bacterium]|nr:response regulator [Alteromonadaceae bacterium]